MTDLNLIFAIDSRNILTMFYVSVGQAATTRVMSSFDSVIYNSEWHFVKWIIYKVRTK